MSQVLMFKVTIAVHVPPTHIYLDHTFSITEVTLFPKASSTLTQRQKQVLVPILGFRYS